MVRSLFVLFRVMQIELPPPPPSSPILYRAAGTVPHLRFADLLGFVIFQLMDDLVQVTPEHEVNLMLVYKIQYKI